MFRRVLVANRGEIAVRVLRTLKRLGVEGVAVHSDADRGAPHTTLATTSVRLGPAAAADSYLRADKVLEAARRTRCEAIHPGYGFLSENADFAQAVEAAGFVWIGPSPAAMRAVGSKASAREVAKKAGLPVAPGGPVADATEAGRMADEVGYPVLLKASDGGGGIGMRVVRSKKEMAGEFAAAQSMAKASFGSDHLILERYLDHPRHIELQVIGDRHGRVVHLGERECSIQRRHQKLVEEAPSTLLDDAQRRDLGEKGLRLAQLAKYSNAGTLEFLWQDGHLQFNEVNARLQVEHPVTEMVYGVDLVEAQLRVAAGEPLPIPADLRPRGHAVEVRVNAEDPLHDHRPTPGPIAAWHMPTGEGLRVDAGVAAGLRVPAAYDSLLAKIIAHGPDRATSITRLATALDETRIEGLTTNLPLQRAILADDAFKQGDLSTRFLEERHVLARVREARTKARGHALAIAAALTAAQRGGPGLAYHRATLPPRIKEVAP